MSSGLAMEYAIRYSQRSDTSMLNRRAFVQTGRGGVIYYHDVLYEDLFFAFQQTLLLDNVVMATQFRIRLSVCYVFDWV